jgi:hypothetical protein
MPRRHSQDRSRLKAVTGVALALAMLALPDSANAEIDLSVESIAGYTNNFERLPEGSDEIPISLGLIGTWTESTRHLTADVEGRVDGITYLNDTIDDEILGQVDAAVVWWAVPERFAWVLENVFGQITTDPFSPIGPENRQNLNFLSTGPDWYIPLGERSRGYLGARYGSAQYEITDDNSERLLGIVGIDRAVSSSSRLGVQASMETVDFDSILQQDFDRNEAYFQYEYSRGEQHGLTVKAGYTWLSSDTGDQSAPLLEVLLSRQLSPSVALQLELANKFSDAGVDFAAGGMPGSGVGTDPGVIPQAGAYEVRSGRGIVDYERSRTILSFAVGVADEVYDTVTLDRRRYEVQVTAERRMTQRMTGFASALWLRNDYESGGLDREDTDIEYRLELRRELGQRTSLGMVGLYSSRSSDDPLTEFEETRGYIVFTYSLR